MIDNDKRYALHEHHHEKKFTERIIIDHTGTFYRLWRGIYVFSCVFSGYVYVYLACFEHAAKDTNLMVFQIFFESIFIISIIIEFLVSYENPRKKDDRIILLDKIATRYVFG